MLAMSTISPKSLRAALVLVAALFAVITLLRVRSSSSYFNPHLTIQFGKQVDWSRFAYTQYVTDTDYLCNSVMLFEALHRLNSKPDRLMMYPDDFSIDDSNDSRQAKLLRLARDKYGVKLKPIQVQSRSGGDRKSTSLAKVCNMAQMPDLNLFHRLTLRNVAVTWAESYTKLLAFNQTEYARVLSLDSDSTVLQVRESNHPVALHADSPVGHG